ncbi:hypothetical protein DF3PB_810001 [uncultured Defluviicoccus sp.]|uniref:Uncharacterized protein n=1 Tax=metagenome TaxID=256318 RepID=A0A380TLR5_9ZZZZ|nr:hypothetical protein DF3PB_2460011 [uncultured Defluviicoccus sp.]SUS08689.1 hypothetical protein DF3PB_810001 [uncultured Defluviicoccus sp.]
MLGRESPDWVAALAPLLAPPFVEEALLLDLTAGFLLLQGALTLKLELPAHIGIGGRLGIALASLLGLAVQGHVAGKPARSGTEQHARRAGTEQGAAGAGAGGGTCNRTHSRRGGSIARAAGQR